MNLTKNLIELKLYMNPTKNLIEPKLYIVDQHGLQGIVTVSYKMYRDPYCNTYQISRYMYVSLVEKVYRYTPSKHFLCTVKLSKLLTTNFCVQNRQVFSLHRLF